MVVVVGIDPTSSPYEGGTHPSTSHNQNIGVSYRYRSGTTAFTEQGAGHYTKDTIVFLLRPRLSTDRPYAGVVALSKH